MTHSTRIWASLMLFIMTVSSCAQSPESLGSSLSPVATILPTRTLTSIPLLTPSLVVSATATVTPTIIPTWPTEEAQVEFLKLLSNNGGCQLPCLWGIVPGESSFQAARAMLAPFGSISDFTAFKSGLGSVSPYVTEGDLEIYTTIDFIADSDNGIVNSIAFNAEAHRPLEQGGYEDVFNSKLFGDKVSTYLLPRVLSEKGIPSSVMIATVGGPLTRGGTGGFDILLLYPDQGILINYTTQLHLVGANVYGCPSNPHVEMELYAAGRPESFFEFLKQTDWAVKMNYYRPLEEATSKSLQEFYEIFRAPTDKCIETPANLWPTPEP
jgi:hypothetical protein